MSSMDAGRRTIRLLRERQTRDQSRLPRFVAMATLLVVVVAGLAQMHWLPAFSADDFGSISFGVG